MKSAGGSETGSERDEAADLGRARLVALMRQVAERDRAAFRELYRATSGKLYGTVLRILPDKDQAGDVVQEVYSKVWERAGDFNPAIASPITWLVTIARNRALDEVRRKRPETVGDDALQDLPDALIDPLAERSRGEELKKLLDCLSGLDEEKRKIVLLAYYRGWSRDELSKRFERPVPTIKTMLHRSLIQLRGCLSNDRT